MTRSSTAALAAIALFAAAPALAQEEPAAPTTYVMGEDGTATHNATGTKCPKEIGELLLVQVLSFDRESDHLGIRCQYVSQRGFTGSISIMKATVPELVGAGDEASRWNRTLYSIMGNYPTALPANVEGLEGDPSKKLHGALFTANAARLGVWQIEDGDWQYSAQTVFVNNPDGWKIAEETRAALIAAKPAGGGRGRR